MESALSSSLALPLETLSAAEHFRRAQRLPRVVDEFVLASSGSHPTKTFGELPVQPHRRLDEIGHADLIFIPALWRNPRRLLARHGQTVREIQRLANDGATVCAVALAATSWPRQIYSMNNPVPRTGTTWTNLRGYFLSFACSVSTLSPRLAICTAPAVSIR